MGLSVLAPAGCASASDEAPSTEARSVSLIRQALSSDVKDACSFSYTQVSSIGSMSIPGTSAGFAGSSFVFADVTGDGKSDIVAATAGDTVTTYVGNGDGTFTKGPETKLPSAPSGKSYVGLGIVATGDFDDDGKTDVALVSTTALSQSLNGSWWGRFVFLYGSATGALGSMVQTGDVMTSGEGTAFHIARDFDGDGRADFFYGNYGYQSVMFSNAGRTFSTASSVGSGNPGGVVALGGATAAASLFFTSSGTSKKITWGSDRTKTTQTLQAPSLSANVVGDLDGDGKLEMAGKSSSPSTLYIGTVDTTSSTSKLYGFIGYVSLITTADLAGDGKNELVYNDDDYAYAACGYTPGATDLVATPLDIALPYGVSLVDAGDLNGDGKTDFVTKKNGVLSAAYLSGPKPAQPAPLVTLSSTPPTPPDPSNPTTKDAGTSQPKKDAGSKAPSSDDPTEPETSDESSDSSEAPAAAGTTTTTSGCAQSPCARSDAAGLLFVGLALTMTARLRRSRRANA